MRRLYTGYINSFRGLSSEVWWLALITLINRAGTMVIPFLSLYLTRDLNFDLGQVGWIMSVFGLGSVVGSWLGGKLTDRIGYYKVMVFSLCLSGLMFLGLQYLTSFVGFCLGIFMLMVVADMFRPSMFVALNAYSKPENKTRSITLIRLAINLGFSAGPALGGLIITSMNYHGLFWVDGITCVFAGLLLLKLLNPKKTRPLETFVPSTEKSAYRDFPYLFFLAALVLFFIAFLQYFSTVPLFYEGVHNLREFEIGLLLGMNGFLIFALEMPLIKYLEGTRHSLMGMVIAGAVLVTLSYVVLTLTSWAGVLVLGMLFMTVWEMVAFPFSNSFALKRARGGNQGEYMALYSISWSVAHVFGHNLGMQLVDHLGFNSTWFVIIGVMAFSMLFLILLNRRLGTQDNSMQG